MDEKNEAIFLVIVFIPRVMVIKMLRMAHFFVFSADGSKKLVSTWAKYLRTPDLTVFFQKMVWLINFGVTVGKILMVEISEELLSQEKATKYFLFKG